MNDGSVDRESASPIELTTDSETKLTESFIGLQQAFDVQNNVYPRWKSVVGQPMPKSLSVRKTKRLKQGGIVAAFCSFF